MLSGKALLRSRSRAGPFVMNTRDEIIQAVQDYQAGKMGHLSRRAGTDHRGLFRRGLSLVLCREATVGAGAGIDGRRQDSALVFWRPFH